MYKFVLNIVFLFALSVSCFGQVRRTIYLVDEQSKRPVQGIEVLADFRPEGPLFQGLSDSMGTFRFYRAGAFKLSLEFTDSFEGFEKVYSVYDSIILIKLKHTAATAVNPVTITSFVPRPVTENPYLTRVITSERIKSMAAQNLSDVLIKEANISLGQDALLGTSAIMQGIGGQDIKILLNGIPVIGRLNGNIDLSQILISNVERIEIIEGPMSVAYGTDALGGVINIITKDPQKKFAGTVNAYADNISNFNVDGNVNFGIKKRFPVSLTLGRYFFNGRDFNTSDRHMDWKPKTKLFATVSTGWQNKWANFKWNSNIFQENLLDQSDAYYNLTSITGYNVTYLTNRYENQLFTTFKLSKHNHFQLQNAYNYYDRRKSTIFRDLVNGNETPVLYDGADTTKFSLFNSRGIFSYFNPANKKFLYIVGYDYNLEKNEGKRILTSNNSIRDLAGFASLEYRPQKKIQIKPSLRIISNSRFGKEFPGSNIKFAPVIPSLQFKFDVSEHIAFRASFSKGYRAPSMKELYFYFVDLNHNIKGNPDLEPELSNNYILSFDYRHVLDKVSGKSTIFNFSMFNNNIRKKIVLALRDNSVNAYTYINIGEYKTQGISTNFEYNSAHYGSSLTGSLIQVYDLLHKADTTTQNYYWLIQVSWNLTYKFPKQNINLTLFSRYTGKQRGYTETSQNYTLPGYYIPDLIATKKIFRNKRNLLDISLGCKNLLNVKSLNSAASSSLGPHNTGGTILITPGRQIIAKFAYYLN